MTDEPDENAILETERLVLEPLRRAHADCLFPVLSDERIYRFIPQDPPTSADPLAVRYERLETRRSASGDQIWLNWAIRIKQQNQYAGYVQATIKQDRTALLAYQLGIRFWGAGFATEACRRVLDLLFDGYGMEAVSAEVDTRNEASIRLVHRLGFERVMERKAVDYFKGSSSDEYLYRLMAPPGHQLA